MATQAERRHETRQRIVTAARACFVDQGIADTTTDQILATAGVSRGAMYHHFATRDEIVAAIYEEEAAASIFRALRRTGDAGSATEVLIAGSLAWLDEACRPETARILIEDGPTALGWQRCREIEGRYSLRTMTAGLAAAVEAGELSVPSIELAALLLNALLAEAALTLVHTPRHRRARRRAEVDETFRAMVDGLRPVNRGRDRP